MVLTTGAKLGPYEIIAPLGAGGMGEVYRARDTRLDRTVAIKILPQHLSANPIAKDRFAREARTIASLNHPNICHLYDVGSQDGVSYLVMEYLEGSTLADRLCRGPLSLTETIKVGAEICEGLSTAHRSGVLHRDLKPGNIMLTKTGAKLVDFGLAKATAIASSVDASLSTISKPLTGAGTIVGTFWYMSPEQLEGREADARSDVFALGAVLYEMVTGKRAFEGKTAASAIAAVLGTKPESISSIKPMVPLSLDRIVQTALAKDPNERFQTVHDLKLQLKWVSEGTPIVPSRTAQSTERWIWISVVCLLFAGLIALWFRKSSVVSQITWSQISAPEKTTFSYFAGPVAVSNDGRTLAFVATSVDGKDFLWTRALGAPSSTALSGTEGASYPFWSADDRSIAFFARGKLKTVGASGGPVITICDAHGARGGAWNQKGDILFSSTWSGINRVPSSGGTPVEVTKIDALHGETSHRWPYFMPDGQHFLYLAANFTGGREEVATIHLAALDSSENRSLFHARSNVAYASGYLLYVRDHMLMVQSFDPKAMEIRGQPFPVAEQVQYDDLTWRGVFSCSDNGVLVYQGATLGAESRMIMFDRNGKEIKMVGSPGNFNGPWISPDGQRLALVSLDSSVANYKLWVYDVAHDKATRLTFGASRDFSPIWAPDGKSIVFGSNQSGPYDLFKIRSDSNGVEEPLLRSTATKNPTDWSSHGFIAFNSTVPGNSKTGMWILPLSGDGKPYVFLQGDFNVGDGHFSPDGKWLAYSSDESGRSEIYVTSFPGVGNKWQISATGGSSPHWRHDGKELFYRGTDSTLMAAEVQGTGSIFEVNAVHPLFHILLSTAAARQDISSTSGQVTFDSAPDGTWFVVNSPPESISPSLTLVLNWTAR